MSEVYINIYTIRASIYVLSTKEGGRRTPFNAGYRPFFCSSRFQGSGSIHPLPDEDRYKIYELGNHYMVDVWLLCPVRVSVGEKFRMQEGNKVIARGEVLAIVDDPCGAEEGE